ncbi:Glycerol kinase 1 [Metarhizium anisopliae]|nr:Glycerol kinase 1 [Metarhizium anisopliae]
MGDAPEPKRPRTGDAEETFVGSIDQGTTSTRFVIFNANGEPVALHQMGFGNIHPESGWHEHDPHELLQTVETCIQQATKKFTDKGFDIAKVHAIGVTNQRETTVLWDKNTGEPLYNAIVWPDTRTKALVRELKAKQGSDKLLGLCGLPLSTYPSSVKLLWLLRNNDAVKAAYDEGRLAFGTIDSWLIFRLNGGIDRQGGTIHVTDPTNASRTMFMNLKTLKYDDQLLSFFAIDRQKIALPEIVPSSHPTAFGTLSRGPLKGVPIAGCLGDQSSALVGQLGFKPGQAKNTYGTGCFLLYNVGTTPVISKSGLLATVAYDFAFSGLFAPYWIDDAKGTVCEFFHPFPLDLKKNHPAHMGKVGLTAHSQKGHIARATLEAACHQTAAILDAMAKDSGRALSSLAVDGGLSNSELCMQTQADLSGIRVDRPAMRETTSLGAAIAAGLATGVWSSIDDLKDINSTHRTVFEPKMGKEERAASRKMWERAVEMCRGWIRDD